MVNVVLGAVLWSTYAETSEFLGEHITSPLGVAALSGGVAGGAQALVAAPAENVRFIFEGGTPATGWSIAWKEVFRGTDDHTTKPKADRIHEAREVRQWMREVGEMAGRGWNGWGWGCAKDICGKDLSLMETIGVPDWGHAGFAIFFSIFEFTRRTATQAKMMAKQHLLNENKEYRKLSKPLRRNTPRIVHALTLVAGGACAGLAYELASRPFDIARKTVHVDRITVPTEHHSMTALLLRKVEAEGLTSFFANPHPTRDGPSSHTRRVLRTLARVGPWGVGFLVWEAFRPGASHTAAGV